MRVKRRDASGSLVDDTVMLPGVLDIEAGMAEEEERGEEEEGKETKLTTVDVLVTYDPTTNMIIVNGVRSKVEKVKEIVQRLDVAEYQVMIEARIVEARTDFSRNLGVEWNNIERQWQKNEGAGWQTDPEQFGNYNDMTVGGNYSTGSPDGWTDNLGFTFARLTNRGLGTVALDANLALAENEGKLNIISAPKVIVRSGELAKIQRGDTFYLPANEMIEAKEVEAKLSLEVTPIVNANMFVNLNVRLLDEQQTADDAKFGKELETTLIIRSGDTVVIGGIYTEEDEKGESGTPGLRKVPLLGWAFKAERKEIEKSELLIFLTPTAFPVTADMPTGSP